MSWEKVKVKDIIEGPISGEWGDSEGQTKILRTTNFNNDGSINLSSVVTRNISKSKIDQKSLSFGDTIIEKSGGSPSQPVGRVVYFNIENEIFLCNNFTSVIRPSSKVNSKYLFWFLFNNHYTGKTQQYQNKTTGIINLQLTRYLTELEIPLPPLPIQKQIADILDKADALRKKDQQLLQKYDELAQAIFIDMFGDPVKNEKGWEVKKLGEICNKITDGTHFSPPSQLSGIPYITAKHVKKEGIDFYSNPTFVSEAHHREIYTRCTPKKGDVLYIKDGATTGIAAINLYDFEFSMLSSLALIKPNLQKLNNYYLAAWLNNENVKESYIRNYMAGAAIRRFTLDKIKRFIILLPPVKLQNKFESLINNMSHQKNKMTIKNSESLFQSLLQQAFKGELIK